MLKPILTDDQQRENRMSWIANETPELHARLTDIENTVTAALAGVAQCECGMWEPGDLEERARRQPTPEEAETAQMWLSMKDQDFSIADDYRASAANTLLSIAAKLTEAAQALLD